MELLSHGLHHLLFILREIIPLHFGEKIRGNQIMVECKPNDCGFEVIVFVLLVKDEFIL
jgi:hypothetical protein